MAESDVWARLNTTGSEKLLHDGHVDVVDKLHCKRLSLGALGGTV
jgi:hypothetical protein